MKAVKGAMKRTNYSHTKLGPRGAGAEEDGLGVEVKGGWSGQEGWSKPKDDGGKDEQGGGGSGKEFVIGEKGGGRSNRAKRMGRRQDGRRKRFKGLWSLRRRWVWLRFTWRNW